VNRFVFRPSDGPIEKLQWEEVRELMKTDGPWPAGYAVDYRADGTISSIMGNPYRGGNSFFFGMDIPEDAEVTIP
jgi:hypothetical protein